MSGFFPGVQLDNDVFVANDAAAGVVPCYGARRFAALGEAAAVLADVRRYSGPARDGRLLHAVYPGVTSTGGHQ